MVGMEGEVHRAVDGRLVEMLTVAILLNNDALVLADVLLHLVLRVFLRLGVLVRVALP